MEAMAVSRRGERKKRRQEIDAHMSSIVRTFRSQNRCESHICRYI
jgi:hypothetical protein